MRRAIILSALVALAAMSQAIAAFQAPPLPPNQVLEIVKVKDNLYLLQGIYTTDPVLPVCPPNCLRAGGNTAVFITDSGVVLVDTKDPGWGQTILDKVKTLTPKPITTIINTHNHSDHTGNNTFFTATVDFVAHENTKANLQREICPAVTNCQAFKGENAKYLPNKTFKDKLSLFSGKDRIDLYYFGRGHTNGDAFIVFPAVRAVHAGDMFAFEGGIPVNAGDGGSALEFPETLAKAVAGIKGVDTVIPGHGLKVLPWTSLDQYQRFTRDIVAWSQEMMKAGKTVDEASNFINQRLYVGGNYSGYQSQPYRIKQAVQSVYDELQSNQRGR